MDEKQKLGPCRYVYCGLTERPSWFVTVCLLVLASLALVLILHFGNRGVQPSDYVPRNRNFSKEAFPKIFHQVWLNYSKGPVPDSWQEATETSRKVNPGWEYRLWSARDVMDLLEQHHPWFIDTYNSYKYNVERADAARYFIVHHYGGLYLDMDEYSLTPVSDILQTHQLHHYDCILPAGTPSGITNYLFLCKKGSPFLAYLASRLRRYNGWYGIPYASVMWSTGPRFVSARYDEFEHKASLFVLPQDKVKEYFGCLFGQSWFSFDGVLIHAVVYPFIRMGVSWTYAVALPLFIILPLLVYWCCYKRHRPCSRPEHVSFK